MREKNQYKWKCFIISLTSVRIVGDQTNRLKPIAFYLNYVMYQSGEATAGMLCYLQCVRDGQ